MKNLIPLPFDLYWCLVWGFWVALSCSLLSKDGVKLVILVYSNPYHFNCPSTRAKRRWSRPTQIPRAVKESRAEVI